VISTLRKVAATHGYVKNGSHRVSRDASCDRSELRRTQIPESDLTIPNLEGEEDLKVPAATGESGAGGPKPAHPWDVRRY